MDRFTRGVENAVASANWYAALALALVLPDICGKLASPTQASSTRYAGWFDRFVRPRYTRGIGPARTPHVFLSGDDCYALRCAYLH